MLGAGGIALIAHTAATARNAIAGNHPVVGYYAAFWLPTAVLGIVAGAVGLWRLRTVP